MNVNFKFPKGYEEPYQSASLLCLPRVGDFVQESRPGSDRYKIKAIVFEIDNERCESVVVEMEMSQLDA